MTGLLPGPRWRRNYRLPACLRIRRSCRRSQAFRTAARSPGPTPVEAMPAPMFPVQVRTGWLSRGQRRRRAAPRQPGASTRPSSSGGVPWRTMPDAARNRSAGDLPYASVGAHTGRMETMYRSERPRWPRRPASSASGRQRPDARLRPRVVDAVMAARIIWLRPVVAAPVGQSSARR